MDQTAINRRLAELGYLWHVPADKVANLASSDQEFRDAALVFQGSHSQDFEARATARYRRVPVQIGEVGPVLMELLQEPRSCHLPDIPPPPGVRFAYDDPDLQKAVESQQRAAEILTARGVSKGSGAWPFGCWASHPKMHRLVVSVDESNMAASWQRDWPTLKDRCRHFYSFTGLRIDFVAKGERADVRLSFVDRSSGWIGLAEYPNGKCDDEVFCYLANRAGTMSFTQRMNLLMHELGHNNWLQHTPGNWIMNPVINNASHDWRKDTHWSTLAEFYGGNGSPDMLIDGPPQPEPPPVPDGLTIEDVRKVVRDEIAQAAARMLRSLS